MRVLIASHIDTAAGGAELALLELLVGLREHSTEVRPEVVVPAKGPQFRRLQELGFPTRVVWQPWWAVWPSESYGQRASRALEIARAVGPMLELIRESKPDLVVTNSIVAPQAAIAAARAGVPHVWQVQEFGDRDHGLAFLLGKRASYSLVRRLSRIVVVPSGAVAAAVGCSATREVRYAVAGEWDSAPWVTAPYASPPPVLVLAGHKKASKGQADAVEALGRLAVRQIRPQLWLVGGGDTDYEQQLRARAVALGVLDQLTLMPPTTNLAKMYAQAGVALMCSRNEALGRVTVEAMKAGLPVVGLDAGATSSLLAEGRGLLYRHGAVDTLADHVQRLLTAPEEAGRMAARAQAWSRSAFSAKAYAEHTSAVWAAAAAS